MANDVFHVVPAGDGWAVKKEGNERATSTHDTQKNAIDAARELAREGDEIVVHRSDGTIRDRTTYAGSTNGNGRVDRENLPQAHDIWSTGTRIRWSPILAGVVCALAVWALMTALATAIGLTAVNNLQPDDIRTAGIIAGITWIVIMVVSLFVGGYVATQTTTRETKFEAVLIGVLVWGTIFALSTMGLMAGSNMALNATRTATAVQSEQPFWNEMGWDETTMRQRMGNLSEEETRRLEAYRDRISNATRNVSPQSTAWWIFAGMVLSIAASIGGAVAGAGPEVTRRMLHRDTTAPGTPALANRESMTV